VIEPGAFRPPALDDPTARAYKDWLHLNLFDHGSGAIGLVNVSLTGSPTDDRTRAVGAALLHMEETGWVGNLEVRGLNDARVEKAGLALEHVALAVDHGADTVTASARLPNDLLELDVTARARVPSVAIEERVPLGPGWFSWYAVGRLSVEGEARVDGRPLDLREATAYHDHNWGRWHWGDDLGWQWGAFQAPDDGPAFVLIRTTDRIHARGEPPALVAYHRALRRSFVGPRVDVAYHGWFDGPIRRVPGALAALHSDRAEPRLPATIRVVADDGVDHVALDFEARGATQLVTADPAVRGYGFIHELVGSVRFEGSLAGESVQGVGLGVVERAE
jgi:hypothetical protein